jgi:hypothetical protein
VREVQHYVLEGFSLALGYLKSSESGRVLRFRFGRPQLEEAERAYEALSPAPGQSPYCPPMLPTFRRQARLAEEVGRGLGEMRG